MPPLSVRPVAALLLALVAVSAGVAAQDPILEPALPAPPPVPLVRQGLVLVDDMWLPESVVHGEGAFVGTPWPGGNVRVAFHASILESRKDRFRKAMAEIEAVAGVDFIEVPPGSGGDTILVVQNTGYPSVSHSDIGVQGGEQILAVGANHWERKYVLAHELFHALGFLHEQSRPDRDTYVDINWSSISQTACNGGSCNSGFDLIPGATAHGAYDFDSIMHYGGSAFGGGQTTIQCRPGYTQYQTVLGNRDHFSNGDANTLQNWYGQPSAPTIAVCAPNVVEATTMSYLMIQVSGTRFHEGSEDGQGLLGTRVRFNGTTLDTMFMNRTTLRASIPGSLLQTPGVYTVDVFNDANAGGVSSSSVNFIVTSPPCLSLGDRVGQAVAGLGDVTGDGRGDYAVGTPGYNSNRGRVRVYSGATGGVIWSQTGPLTGSLYGAALSSVGDVTGDGREDLLIGIPGYSSNAGRFEIRSGANGALHSAVNSSLGGVRFGWSVAGVGDADGDGDNDFLIGVLGFIPVSGRAELWSSNGGLMRTHTGGNPLSPIGDLYGYAVGGGEDVDLDGRPDYIVGDPAYDIVPFVLPNPGPTVHDVGRVHIYSGATGIELTTRNGDGQYDHFGWSVAIIPNTTTGGPLGTIVVGAPEIPDPSTGVGNGRGYVRTFGPASFSGADFPTLATWTGATTGDRFGLCVASAGDANDDGQNDILIGIPQSTVLNQSVGPGTFEIRSANGGGVLYRHQARSSDEQLGWSVSLVGDTDGDARLDYIVGAPNSDAGCLDAGGYVLVHAPVPPEHQKVMITEVSTGNPDCVEITNFGLASVNLGSLTLRWKDGSTLVSTSINASVGPGQSIVVKEPGGTLPETPGNVTVLSILPTIGTTTGDVAVALVDWSGDVQDEVHLESSTGAYVEGSLGGKFRGVVTNLQTQSGEVNAERIWGLDSNSGRDWTTGGARTMGLENTSAGIRGTDPVSKGVVRINEIDDSPDYIELYRPASGFPIDLQNWHLLASARNGLAHVRLTPFTDTQLLGTNSYLVIGDGPTAPGELPASHVPYLFGGGNIPFVTEEYSCALYDSFGRLVDLMRTSGHNDPVPHNEPRAPSHASDFTGVAGRGSTGDAAVGRNGAGTDTDTGSDFRERPTRTMGSSNSTSAFSTGWTPDPATGFNVVLNDTASGGGITAIMNAGLEHAGEKWTFTFSYGHLQGAGPILGLNLEAVDHWLALSVTPPFSGILDSRGSARMDFPAGSLPPGVDTDDLFFTQPDNGNPLALFSLISPILEFDT